MLLDPLQARARYAHAAREGYAILAVNADSGAALTDCLEAARECKAPIIIETSLWQLVGRSFGVGDAFMGMDRYLAQLRVMASCRRYRDVPVMYHTDHIRGVETLPLLKHAIAQGASSISLDSSDLTAEENIGLLLELCQEAARMERPVALEMEAGVDDGVTPLAEAAALFGAVEKAAPGNLALWAPGVGTQHGLTSGTGLDLDAIRAHRDLVSTIAGRPIGLALHGSSGLSLAQLTAAAEAGVAKVNWSSESLLIRSRAARDYYEAFGAHLTPGDVHFKPTAVDHGLQVFVAERYVPRVVERIRALGGEGRA